MLSRASSVGRVVWVSAFTGAAAARRPSEQLLKQGAASLKYSYGYAPSTKLAMSTMQGNKDICDVLTQDHNDAKKLLDEAANTMDNKARRDFSDKAIAELVRHAVAEEMYVYPLIRDHIPQGHEFFDHDLKEHHDLEEAMAKLEKADASAPEFKQHLQEVKTLLDHHAESEENKQFPELRKHVPKDKLMSVVSSFENVKKMAPTHPHPNAPAGPTARTVLGPAAGLADKLRDALTGRNT